jgi:hypothetical protein
VILRILVAGGNLPPATFEALSLTRSVQRAWSIA